VFGSGAAQCPTATESRSSPEGLEVLGLAPQFLNEWPLARPGGLDEMPFGREMAKDGAQTSRRDLLRPAGWAGKRKNLD
jgi:hypothetical protein